MIGRPLGHYEVLERVGAGGMGEVYRARDTRLHRDVAIKILPARFLGDVELRARFEREARLLAAVNHPHIAAIHGLEENEGVLFLVLEYVAGSDLDKRLAQGPLPVDEVLTVAGQIADALDSAHRQGVIHRDLKPSNVAFATDGSVKVLDFGLAKALDVGSANSPSVSQSPTLLGATGSQVILGTAAYMSPEQARGNVVDARTDVWAFGCLVYECLTGHRAFEGASISDTLAAVLRDAVDWGRLPSSTPPALHRLLRRCIERDPARRLHSLADARLDLEEAAVERQRGIHRTSEGAKGSFVARWYVLLPWILATVLAVSLVGVITLDRPATAPKQVVRFTIAVDSLETSSLCPPVISPQGDRLAYSAAGHLWIRDLDDLQPRSLDGTEGAVGAFWSPDGSSLGFHARKRLWKIAVDGGPPIPICDTPDEYGNVGGSGWGEDGHIIFGSSMSGIYRVSAGGGAPVSLLEPVPGEESDFHSPSLLPDGMGVLFVPHLLVGVRSRLDALIDGHRRTLWTHPWDVSIEFPTNDGSGHILYRREQPNAGIWAVPFSLEKLHVEGEPFLVASEGEVPRVSRNGTLVYAGGGQSDHDLVRVDMQGNIVGAEDSGRHIDDTAYAPSGDLLLQTYMEGSINTIVVRDLRRGTRTTVISGPQMVNPFWISDASIGVVRPDSTQLVMFDLDLANTPRVLFRGDGRGTLQRQSASPVVSADGRYLAFVFGAVETRSDIWLLPLNGSGEASPLLVSPAREECPQISPLGDLMAYVSDESGRFEVYVSPFAPGRSASLRRSQVSSDGGNSPRWSRDGKHLYYESNGKLMEVEIGTGAGFSLGRPRALFDLTARHLEPFHGYALTPDGEGFLLVQVGGSEETRREIVVVQNWVEEFRPR